MTTNKEWFLNRLKTDWPKLHDIMATTEFLGIPLAVRFADWLVLHFFTMRNELIDETCKDVQAQFGKTPMTDTICEFLTRKRETLNSTYARHTNENAEQAGRRP